MTQLNIFMKSGQIIKLMCEEFTFTYDSSSLEYTGYKFKGLKNFKQIGLVPNQIAGYVELT